MIFDNSNVPVEFVCKLIFVTVPVGAVAEQLKVISLSGETKLFSGEIKLVADPLT